MSHVIFVQNPQWSLVGDAGEQNSSLGKMKGKHGAFIMPFLCTVYPAIYLKRGSFSQMEME